MLGLTSSASLGEAITSNTEALFHKSPFFTAKTLEPARIFFPEGLIFTSSMICMSSSVSMVGKGAAGAGRWAGLV